MPTQPGKPDQLLRDELRQRRRDIPPHMRSTHDQAIRGHLLQAISSRGITSLAAYWPFDGEPDLVPLCQQLMSSTFEVALPVVSGRSDHAMEFHHWYAETSLKQNQYGIREPLKTSSISLAGFDMLLMPLVAYDKSGNRVGMGSGYYDRHLESLREASQPLRVGVAYSLQEVAKLKKNDWDVPLHAVVTEHGWVSFD